jgi:hypothetical protein
MYAPVVTNWYSVIYNAFLFVGVIIVAITLFISSSSALTGTMFGYSFVAVGLLLFLGYLLKNMSGSRGGILSILITLAPFLLLLGILFYMIYLISVYFDRISSGQISPSYYLFSKLFALMLVVQLFIMLHGTETQQFKQTKTLGKVTNLMLFLTELINGVIAIVIGIILKYFSTDG